MLEIKITIACPDLVLAATAIAKAAGLRSTQNEGPKPTTDNGNTSAHIAQPTTQPTPAVPVNPTPAQTSAPSNPNPAPQVPLSAAPEYTLEQLARAGATLVSRDPAKAKAAQELLQRFGVASVSALPKERYGEFATALRGLGAEI